MSQKTKLPSRCFCSHPKSKALVTLVAPISIPSMVRNVSICVCCTTKKDGRPTQWFIIFTSPDKLGNLPFMTYNFTGREQVDKMPNGSEQRGPELKPKKVAYK